MTEKGKLPKKAVETFEGESLSAYYRKILQRRDNAVLPSDSKEVTEQKYGQSLHRLNAIVAAVQTFGFQLIETALVDDLETIERVDIWDALATKDSEKILACRAKRAGILMLFDKFAFLKADITELKRELGLDKEPTTGSEPTQEELET